MLRAAALAAGDRHRRLDRRWRSSRRCSTASLGLATRGRRCGCRGWPVWAAAAWVAVEALRGRRAVRRLPLGPARLRRRRHPGRRRVRLRRRRPASTFVVALLGTTLAWAVLRRPPGAGRGRSRGGRCWPLAWPGLAAALRRRRRRAAAPSRWRRCRATCRARGSTRSPSAGRCSTTTCDATLGLADRVDAGPARRSPTSWSGRRTPPTSTRSPTRAPAPRSARPREAVGVPDAGGRRRRRRADARLVQPGIVWRPDGRPGRVLRQAPPGAVRRVHPAPRRCSRRASPAARPDPAATWSAAPARACCGSARRAVGDADVLRGRLRRAAPRPGRRRRRAARGARPTTRRTPAPARSSSSSRSSRLRADRDRALRRGRRHQRHLRHRRARTAHVVGRAPSRGPGPCSSTQVGADHRPDHPGGPARAAGPSWLLVAGLACGRRSLVGLRRRLSSAAARAPTTGEHEQPDERRT